MTKHVSFHVEDMHCQSCVKKITAALQELNQDYQLNCDVEQRNVSVIFEPSETSAMIFKKQIEQAGFKVTKMESEELS